MPQLELNGTPPWRFPVGQTVHPPIFYCNGEGKGECLNRSPTRGRRGLQREETYWTPVGWRAVLFTLWETIVMDTPEEIEEE